MKEPARWASVTSFGGNKVQNFVISWTLEYLECGVLINDRVFRIEKVAPKEKMPKSFRWKTIIFPIKKILFILLNDDHSFLLFCCCASCRTWGMGFIAMGTIPYFQTDPHHIKKKTLGSVSHHYRKIAIYRWISHYFWFHMQNSQAELTGKSTKIGCICWSAFMSSGWMDM